MKRRDPFPPTTPKGEKTRVERTTVWTTPLALRSRVDLSETNRLEVRAQLARKLGNFAEHLDRVTVRFDDVNGPRGGIDAVCRIKVALRGLPSVVVEERAADVLVAMGRAMEVAGRAVRRTLRRAGWSLPRGDRVSGPQAALQRARAARPNDDGSLIGRRVGQGQANLEQALARPEKQRRDVYVDTAAPGVSASDRRVGYGATARRNTKRNTAGMAAALEDSRTTPSRKSTRKSKNRAKAATLLERKAQLKLQSPTTRATRASAQRT